MAFTSETKKELENYISDIYLIKSGMSHIFIHLLRIKV